MEAIDWIPHRASVQTWASIDAFADAHLRERLSDSELILQAVDARVVVQRKVVDTAIWLRVNLQVLPHIANEFVHKLRDLGDLNTVTVCLIVSFRDHYLVPPFSQYFIKHLDKVLKVVPDNQKLAGLVLWWLDPQINFIRPLICNCLTLWDYAYSVVSLLIFCHYSCGFRACAATLNSITSEWEIKLRF